MVKLEVTRLQKDNQNGDKQWQILEAAIEEFTCKGYEKASTNGIVKRAGVSKGLLFHYYSNKKNLFLQAFDMVLAQIDPLIYQQLSILSTDFVERILEISYWKGKIAQEYPLYNRFLWLAMAETPPELKAEMEIRRNYLTEKYMPLLQEGIDFSLFKEGLNQQKAMELVLLFTTAYGEKVAKIYSQVEDKSKFDLNVFIEELKVYLDMLKDGIYK